MERVLERTLAAAEGSSVFRHAVAEMAMQHEASRCLTYHALRPSRTGQTRCAR